MPRRPVQNLEDMLEAIEKAAKKREKVSVDAILDEVGRRSFGPLLLFGGLVAFAPLVGDIPGVPTLVGLFVVIVATQLIFLRKRIWLPQWLLDRSVKRDTLCKALDWMRKPARFTDRLLRPRLQMLTGPVATYAMAVVSFVVGAAMPAMEIVPFTANVAGAALMAFGLSLIAHDGVLALCGFVFTAGTVAVVVQKLL